MHANLLLIIIHAYHVVIDAYIYIYMHTQVSNIGITNLVAGTSLVDFYGSTGAGGASTSADSKLYPYGLSVDVSGNLYLATINIIRKVLLLHKFFYSCHIE